VAFGIVGVGHRYPFTDRGPDTAYYFLAGKCLLHGRSPYDPAAFALENRGFGDVRNEGFFYPPHFAPLCLFMAVLPYLGAKILLLLINLGFLIVLIRVCAGPPGTPSDPGVPDPAPEARWLIPAIILGNTLTGQVLWMGQTTLIAVAAISAGWVLARRGRSVPAGILIGLSTIKPQLVILPCLWLLLEGRWKALFTGAATTVILAVPMMIVLGPVGAFAGWAEAVGRYDGQVFNTVGFPHLFSAQNFLWAMGITAPSLAPLGLAAMAVLWGLRFRIDSRDVLPLLVGITLVSGRSHDYDLSALALLVPAFWRHLRGREGPAILALGLAAILSIPPCLVEPLRNDLLLQFRYPMVVVLFGWLLALSARGAPIPVRRVRNAGVSREATSTSSFSSR
jgi:hypothetical protein